MTKYATFKLAMAKTGPDATFHVVWGLGISSIYVSDFFFFVYLRY